MHRFTLARIKSKYPVETDSGYSSNHDKYVDSLFQWHSTNYNYFKPWERERYILSEALSQPESQSDSLADRVFGNQARQEKLHLLHEANLLAHRYDLHKRHFNDINRQIMRFQEQLSIERMHSPSYVSRGQRDLEKLLVNLEAQKRDEDIGFWKDSLKIRQELLQGAGEYQATRHRAEIMKGLEVEYGEEL